MRCGLGKSRGCHLSGWNNTQAHVTFSSRQKGHGDGVSDHAAILGLYEELLVLHAWDLERICNHT